MTFLFSVNSTGLQVPGKLFRSRNHFDCYKDALHLLQLSDDLQTCHKPWLCSSIYTHIIYSILSSLSFSVLRFSWQFWGTSVEQFPESSDSNPLLSQNEDVAAAFRASNYLTSWTQTVSTPVTGTTLCPTFCGNIKIFTGFSTKFWISEKQLFWKFWCLIHLYKYFHYLL